MTKNDLYEVELKELVAVVWRYKFVVLLINIVFFVVTLVIVQGLKDVYKSEVLLSPSSEDSGFDLSGQLGSIASLAGINLADKKANKTDLALSLLQSRDFIYRFIDRHNIIVPLMASNGWDRESNELLINNKLYDAEREEWIRVVSAPYKTIPSLQEAYKVFMKSFSVAKMKETGLVTVSFRHHSPHLAKTWLDLIVKDLNQELRQLDLKDAEKSIDYLSGQVSKTTVAESRNMLYSLIEQQTKVVMLANVRDDYVFKTIDPAIVPIEKDGPKRLIILIISCLLSLFIAVGLILFYKYVLKK